VLWPWLGAKAGWSFTAGGLWMALNFLLLSWLLEAVIQGKRTSKLFIFAMACAKIPASYFVLYRLYTVGYLDAIGLTAGLVLLPAVLVFRGLSRGSQERAKEEG